MWCDGQCEKGDEKAWKQVSLKVFLMNGKHADETSASKQATAAPMSLISTCVHLHFFLQLCTALRTCIEKGVHSDLD